MTTFRTALILAALHVAALAHPMGNFSVNHYSRLYFQGTGVELTYVLDLAEIPTFQLLGSWQADAKDRALVDGKAREQAAEWVANLPLLQGGRKISWQIRSITPKTEDGAGGMPLLRIVVVADAALQSGSVRYEDLNFPGRAGWKEIVIDSGAGARIGHAAPGSKDLSKALTVYPTDPSVTPPQDLVATAEWSPAPATQTASSVADAATPVASEASPAGNSAPDASFAQQQPSAPGSVMRGDFLSRALRQRVLGWRLISLCVMAAFGLGCLHALSPGHGKTIVAAYLVGSRGTLKHAGILGFVVTFTHTFTVFLLGLGVLFFQQYVSPEKIVPVLAVISGLSIVAVGVSLLYQRSKVLMGTGHHHGGSTHSHQIDGEITPSGLVALGVSGGLVPCPSALVLMLSAIALGRPALGLVLLIGFSSGLALVLMSIGMLALFARHLLPDSEKTARSPVFRLIPVFSAVVVIFLGLAITATSAGWVQPLRFLS